MALGQMWGRRRGHWPSKLKSGAWDRGISRDADLWPRGERQRSEIRSRPRDRTVEVSLGHLAGPWGVLGASG